MFQLTLAMILWGTLGAFVLWSGLPAVDIAFYRCLLGAVLMGAWLIKSRNKIPFDKNTGIVALAGIFLVTNWVLLFKSFQVSNITIGNMSYYLQPIILIILGIALYREKVSFYKWVLIALALVGVLLTIDLRNLYSPHIVMGVFLALAAAFFYSLLTLFMKGIHMNYFKVIFIQLTVGVIMLFPFIHFQPLSFVAIICLVIIGVMHTLLAYFLYYDAIKKTSFSQIAILSYLDPVVAIIADVVFFNRELNTYQMMGVGLTFAALYLLVNVPKPRVRVVKTV